jgi:hypothetical protein
MPRKNLGPCSVVAVDPGTTTGLLVVSVDPRWLKGFGPASWEGLGAAVKFKAAYQVGRVPRRFDIDRGRSMKIDKPEGLDEEMLPVLADHQPLMGDGEFDGRGRNDQSFYAILRGDPSGEVGRADFLYVDAGEVLQVRQIAGLLDNFSEAALVIENFIPRPTVSTDREVNSADRLRLGIQTEEVLHGRGRVAFLQTPGDAMRSATDERLKRARLYFAGMQHSTDAARHACLFLRRCRNDESLRAQAFPRHFTADWE